MTEQNNKNPLPPLVLSLIPPSPVTDMIEVEIRGTVRNSEADTRTVQASLYLDEITPDALLWQDKLEVAGNAVTGFSTRLATTGKAGHHRVILDVSGNEDSQRCERDLEIIASSTRSPRTIGGAWVGLMHWSEGEGRYWNDMLRTFDAADWTRLIDDMHEIELDLVVIQESWRCEAFYGEDYHSMTEDNFRKTYPGKAYYPSRLWDARMDIACEDPIEAILLAADKNQMHVMLPIGMYAHFDYSPGSLAWHKLVVTELWERYGHHPSCYGWYISGEMPGHLKPHEQRYWHHTETYRRDVLDFLKGLTAHINTFAPEMPLMLSPNCFGMDTALDTWEKLSPYCAIIAIQGNMNKAAGPDHDATLQQMRKITDATGAHLWMHLEAFGFEHPDTDEAQRECHSWPSSPDEQHDALLPMSMSYIVDVLERFDLYEFICTYQFPGIFCHPDATKQLGGSAAIQLYRDYQDYIKSLRNDKPASE